MHASRKTLAFIRMLWSIEPLPVGEICLLRNVKRGFIRFTGVRELRIEHDMGEVCIVEYCVCGTSLN